MVIIKTLIELPTLHRKLCQLGFQSAVFFSKLCKMCFFTRHSIVSVAIDRVTDSWSKLKTERASTITRKWYDIRISTERKRVVDYRLVPSLVNMVLPGPIVGIEHRT